jgi:hypothetical protein
VKEYKATLLFENRQVSGGGFPLNFELIDKTMEMLLRILEQSFITAT